MLPPPSLFQTTRQSFIEEAIESALDAAWADGLALSFQENGMREPTRYGQKIEDEAEEDAADLFDTLLKSYLAAAASFNDESEHQNEIGHAMNKVDDGYLTDAQIEALNRIATTHEAFLKTAISTQEKTEQTKKTTPTRAPTHSAPTHSKPHTMPHHEKRDLAQFLLKAPLEFADHTTADLLNETDQAFFTQILHKLRALAAL